MTDGDPGAGPPEQPPEYKVYRSGEEPDRERPQPEGGQADYKVYRSRRRWRDRLSSPGDRWQNLLKERPRRDPDAPRRGKAFWVKRGLKWLAIAVVGWILLSVVLFFISAQLNKGLPKSATESLSHGGNLLTGSTILVLGSDQRPEGEHEPGAVGPGRSDSIMLLHSAFGSVRRLSIPRDSYANIPGHGSQKINAAYAIGGAGLAVKTIEDFLGNGVKINHVVEVSFQDFPKLIDSLGGIDVTLKRCVVSRNVFENGDVFRLHRGTHHLSGKQALEFSRIRENKCAPNETDIQRAERQQLVLQRIRAKALSPTTFFRLPWVAWDAPRAVRTDLGGIGMGALIGDLVTGGSGSTHVLKPSGVGPGTSLIISPAERQAAVK
ncbi:MAG TPA: LCP family protein, partial [Thermoleophilaceae bacterium]|nr:LCP family protein [Thermoleophilaceae bacterium]